MSIKVYADQIDTPDGRVERAFIQTDDTRIQAVHPKGGPLVSVKLNNGPLRLIPEDGFLDWLFRMIGMEG